LFLKTCTCSPRSIALHHWDASAFPSSQVLKSVLLVLPITEYGRQINEREKTAAQREAMPSSASC